MADEELFTVTQAAERLGMHRTAVHRALVQGRLGAQRVGSTWIMRQEDIEEYERRPKHPGGRPRTMVRETLKDRAEEPDEE